MASYPRMRAFRATLLASGIVCAAFGCSGHLLPSDVNGEPEGSGAAATDGAAPGDDGSANGSDAGSGPSAESDGGASCTSPATGPCNAVALQGPPIMPTTSGAAAPPMSGGAIADGTYVLTAITTYDGTTVDGSTEPLGPAERATLVVAGGCIQWNDSIDGTANVYSSSAEQLTFQRCSGPTVTWWASYAASTTTLLLEPFSAGGATPVYTYTRQ